MQVYGSCKCETWVLLLSRGILWYCRLYCDSFLPELTDRYRNSFKNCLGALSHVQRLGCLNQTLMHFPSQCSSLGTGSPSSSKQTLAQLDCSEKATHEKASQNTQVHFHTKCFCFLVPLTMYSLKPKGKWHQSTFQTDLDSNRLIGVKSLQMYQLVCSVKCINLNDFMNETWLECVTVFHNFYANMKLDN